MFQDQSLTRNQRFGHVFALGFAALGLLIGLNLRSALLYETVEYFDAEAGIRLNYPAGWLVDTGGLDYIFRAQDTSRAGYKTTMQISTSAVSPDMTARNVLDDLSLFRQTRFASYDLLSVPSPTTLPDGEPATLVEYTFGYRERSPFQQSIPVIVYGRDLLVIRQGQAILLTFQADSRTYETDLDIFERFLESLEF